MIESPSMKNQIASLSFFILGLTACSVPFDDLKITGSGDAPLFNFQQASVNFKTVQETSLSSCLRCHAGGKLDLRDPQVVIDSREKILKSITTGSMPPRSSGLKSLSPCETEILQTWIEDQLVQRKSSATVAELSKCGNFKKAPAEKPVDISKLEPTFANVKTHIFAMKCLECHQEGKAKGKTNLETMEYIEAKGLITPFYEQSKLYIRTHRRGKGQMPPVQSGIPVLTDVEMDLLKRWLQKEAEDRGIAGVEEPGQENPTVSP